MLDVVALEGEVAGAIADARVPGLALAVVQGERVVYARGFGVTCTEEHGQPVTPDTLFRVGSVTKPLTGTAALRLVDAGALDLDAPVRKYVPWFELSQPGAAERVTLRMLLTHTSGLPHDHKPFGSRDPEALERRIREELPRYALVAPPGTAFSYSNAGIHTLAYVIEVVTGRHYTAAMDDLLFRPLAMGRTTFDPTVALTHPLALSHTLGEDGALRVERRFADNAAHAASGQAISTVRDLAHFAILHLNGGRFGGAQVLSAAAVQEMHRPQVERPPSRERYGLTFSVRAYKGLTLVGHNGAITNYGAVFRMAMEARAAVVTLYNRLTGDERMDRLADRILDRVLGLPPDAAVQGSVP